MRNFLLLSFSLFLIFVLIGCSSDEVDVKGNETENVESNSVSNDAEYEEPEIVFRFSDVPSEHDEMIEANRYFADYIFEKTNGKIKVEVYPGAQLGNNEEVIQSVKMGAIDIARMQMPIINESGVNDSRLTVLGLPYIFDDFEHAWKVLRGEIGQEVIDVVNESDIGIIGLGFMEVTARNFFTTDTPIRTMDDMKGLKIRVQSSPMYLDMVKAFGASPTPIAFSELYSGLQTGVVDGAENPIKGFYNDKFYEVAKYYSLNPNDSAEPSLLFISKISWEVLSDEEKEIFKEAAYEAGVFLEEKTKENVAGYMEKLEDEGVELVEIEDYENWVEAVQPLYEKYGEDNEDFIQRIKDFQ